MRGLNVLMTPDFKSRELGPQRNLSEPAGFERQVAGAERLMELDPKYVDVSVRRWQKFSGGTATLEADGCTFDQVARERAA